jgi:hypothetical protein
VTNRKLRSGPENSRVLEFDHAAPRSSLGRCRRGAGRWARGLVALYGDAVDVVGVDAVDSAVVVGVVVAEVAVVGR